LPPAGKHFAIALHPPAFGLSQTHCMNCSVTVWHEDGHPGPAAPQTCMMPQNCLQSHTQGPQSVGHEAHVSAAPQAPSPHAAHGPQSAGHAKQFSVAAQVPSPQPAQKPQSAGHEAHVSAAPQVPSPHAGHGPQSSGQPSHVSKLALHTPSPHAGHEPQSSGHEPHVSSPSHAPFGHVSQTPQSATQLPQVSPAAQVPLPQPGHRPQSGKHVMQLSSAAQAPSPHARASGASCPDTRSERAPHAATSTTAATARIVIERACWRREEAREDMGNLRVVEAAGRTGGHAALDMLTVVACSV
jgi:hypothetical protein